MNNKKRLIYADEALRMMENSKHDNPCTDRKLGGVWDVAHDCAISCVEACPTVDAVALPCKIGDSVWAIRNFRGKEHPQQGIVGEMYFTKEMKLHIVVSHISRGEWGKTVFATYEEAEAALAKMDGDGNV